MDKSALFSALYDPSVSGGQLDELLGFRPITEEERAGWRKEQEDELRTLTGEQRVEPSLGRLPELKGNLKKRAEQFAPIYQQVSEKYGVPFDLLMAQAHQESLFNPAAVSTAGAEGIAQFMPGTAGQYGLKNRRDPIASADAQARYMRDLLNQFGGNEDLAIAAYNAGPGSVRKAKGIPQNDQTPGYVSRVKQLRGLYGPGTIQAPAETFAGSPADQILPTQPDAQQGPDLSGFEPIMLSNKQQAYMEKGLTLEEAAKRLKEMKIDAEPMRQFSIQSDTPVYVPYDMDDKEALGFLRKEHPDILKAANLPTDTSAWGAYKQQLATATGQLGVAAGIGLEELGAEGMGKALQEKGKALEEEAKGMFVEPTEAEAGVMKRYVGLPLARGAASLTAVAPALLAGGPGGLAAAGVLSGAQEYGALEQKAREEGKPFERTEALAPAAAIGVVNAAADKFLLPFFKLASSEAGVASGKAIKELVESEGMDVARQKVGSYVGDMLKQAGMAEASGASADVASHLIEKAYEGKPIDSADTWDEIKGILAEGAPTYLTLGAFGGAGEQYTKRTELERVKEAQEAEFKMAEQKQKAEARLQKRLGTIEAPEGEVAEPTLRTPEALPGEEKPASFKDLNLKGFGSSTARKSLGNFDIENPEHGAVINQALDIIEADPKIKHNPAAMQAIRTKVQEVQDASQIESPVPRYDRGLEGPQGGEEIGYPTEGGEGVRVSDQVGEEAARESQIPEEEIVAENLDLARQRLRNQGISAEMVEPDLGERMAQGARNLISEGRKSDLYSEVVNKNAALRNIEKNMPEMVAGQLRPDLQTSGTIQIGNVISQSLHEGPIKVNSDGSIMVQPDETRAPIKLLNKAHKGGYYKEVMEVLPTMRYFDFERQANEHSDYAANLRREAEQLRADAEQADSAAEARPLKTKANKLDRMADAADAKANELQAQNRTVITPEQAKTAKQVYEQHAGVKETVEGIHGYLQSLLDAMHKGNLLTDKQYADYKKNVYYFPFHDISKNDMDAVLQDPYSYAKAYFSQMGSSGKSMPSHKRQKFQQHKIFTEENLIKHGGFTTNWVAQNMNRLNALDWMEPAGVAEYVEPVHKSDKDVVQVYRKGVQEYYRIKDPVIFAAMQTAGPALSPLFKTIGKMTGIVRSGMLLTPKFGVGQLLREGLSASFVSRSGMVTPFDTVKNFGKILAGKSEGYKELKNRGILSAPDVIADPANFLREVENQPGFHKIAKNVQHLFEVLDGATRVGVYEKTLKNELRRGRSEADAKNIAASRAREIINFSTQGRSQSIRNLKAMTPFMNSAILGLDVLARAAFPRALGKLSKAEAMEARKLFYARAAFLSAFTMAYAAMMSDDEDYVKSQDRALNFLIPNPTADEEHPFIKLPGVPFEAGFGFKVVPETLALWSMGKINTERAVKELKAGAMNLVVDGLLPTMYIIQPALENYINYSLHFGKPVESNPDEIAKYRDERASDLAKEFFKLLDDNGITVPLMESPDKLEHLMQGYGSQYWSMTKLMADAYLRNREGAPVKPERSWMDLPLVKDFYSSTARSTQAEDFYEVAKSANQLMNSLHDAENKFNEDKYNDLIKDPKALKLMQNQPGIAEAQKQLAELNKNIKYIEEIKDPAMTAPRKAEVIREYKRDRNAKLAEMMNALKAAGIVEE